MIDPMHEQQLQWIADYPHGGKQPATLGEQYQTLHAESAAILARAAWVQIHARDVPASERIEFLRGEILTDLSAAMRMLEAAAGVRMQPNPHPHIPPETGLFPAEVAKVVPVHPEASPVGRLLCSVCRITFSPSKESDGLRLENGEWVCPRCGR